jgi:hypothetical protein
MMRCCFNPILIAHSDHKRQGRPLCSSISRLSVPESNNSLIDIGMVQQAIVSTTAEDIALNVSEGRQSIFCSVTQWRWPILRRCTEICYTKQKSTSFETDRRSWARTWILIILLTTDQARTLETLENKKYTTPYSNTVLHAHLRRAEWVSAIISCRALAQ